MDDTRKRLVEHCKFVCTELRSVMDGENEEYGDIYEYLADALDVEYRLSSTLDLLGVEVSIMLGGPNVWIDTYHATVEGAWGTSRVSLGLDRDICAEINDYYDEYIRNFIR